MAVVPFESMFSSQRDASDALANLAHLAELSTSLGRQPDEREANRERLKTIAEDLLRESSSSPPDRLFSSASLREKTTPIFSYFDPTQSELTAEQVHNTALRMLTDHASVSVVPVRKSRLGKNGPVFLIDYPCSSPDSTRPVFRSFVVKVADGPSEVTSNRIYEVFSRCIHPSRTCRFLIPRSSWIDFLKNKYISSAGAEHPISADTSLPRSLIRIGTCAKSVLSSKDLSRPVILSEKIQGQPVLDFVTSQDYEEATPLRKEAFFRQIGSTAMLDMLMGNVDRFAAIDPDTGELVEKGLPANLGNALVVLPHDDNDNLSLVLIDNGMSRVFCRGETDRTEWSRSHARIRYEELMTRILSSDAGLTTLSSNIVSALRDSKKTTDRSTQPRFADFLADLKNPVLSLDNIRAGAQQMRDAIIEDILPFWMGPNSRELRRQLESDCDDIMLTHLDKRCSIFAGCSAPA